MIFENELLITIAKALKVGLDDVSIMYAEQSQSSDFIIGYLQGTIKGVIGVIEENEINNTVK